MDGKIEVDDYKEMKSKFEPEMLKLKQDLVFYNSNDENIATYLEHTLEMLQNIDKYYAEADLSLKTTLISSIFPEKLIFNEKEYRTQIMNPAVSLIYRLNADFSAKKTGLFRTKSKKSTCVTPIAGYSNPEVIEELRALWKIKLYMDEVVKTKKLKREKSDIVQRRRK